VGHIVLPKYLLYREKTAVLRGAAIADQGVLVKHGGKQAVHGYTNAQTFAVKKATSENPTAKAQDQIENQKQLRIDLERETSGTSVPVKV
jgi:hypothetical protein